MKVLLVAPPISGEERYGALASAGTYLPPLGLAYLAAVAERRHDVSIVDAEVLGWSEARVAEEVRRLAPRVVGITAVTPRLPRALSICRAVKALDPGITTVLGGPYPSACPLATVAAPEVDLAVVGEGESTARGAFSVLRYVGRRAAV